MSLSKSLFFAFFMILTLSLPAKAAPSAFDKLAELEAELEQRRSVDHHTLAAPLYSGLGHQGLAGGTFLKSIVSMVGTEGDLEYQKYGDQAYRLRFDDLRQDASFFWFFDRPLDLRDRWFRLHYSGLAVPSHAFLQFDHREMRNDSRYDLYFEESLTPDTLYFKLPAKLSFSQIETLKLGFDPERLMLKHHDFLILGLELLPEEADPLSTLPASDLSRFDWHKSSFEAENRIPLSAAAQAF